MARDGSGTYTLPAGNPVVTGTTISSTWANNTFTDVASALTQSLSKDGQTTMTGNQPMAGNKHTGVGNATARDQYAALGQVQDSAATYLTSVAGTNTITASVSGLAAYAAGQTFRFVAAGNNTGAVTININSIGAKAVTKQGTTALVSGDIVSGSTVTITYDGTQFQLDPVPGTLALTAVTATTVTANTSVVTDTISEKTSAAGVTVDGVLLQDNDVQADEVRTDTISEKTSAAGVTIDGVLIKDGEVAASARPISIGTLVTASTQTELTFTSIPSWVKKITLSYAGLSTNGTNAVVLLQLGDSGGYETASYSTGLLQSTGSGNSMLGSATNGMYISFNNATTYFLDGIFTLTLIDAATNTWVGAGSATARGTNVSYVTSGSKALSATLDRLRMYVDGTVQFDAGSVNILYE